MSDILTYFYFLKIIEDNISDQNVIDQKIKGFLVDALYRIQIDLDKKLKSGEILQNDYDHYWNIIKTS